MNPDDSLFLTAYLDGELDAGQRLEVESRLRSNPALAEQLHRLAAVRELVSSLSRPPLTVNLSGAVRLRIERGRRSPLVALGRWTVRGARPLGAVGVGLGAAAAVLLALSFGTGGGRHGAVAPPRPGAGSPVALAPGAPARSEERPAAASATGSPRLVLNDAVRPQPPGANLPPITARLGPDAERDPNRLGRLLDNPRLHRVFFVIDDLGGGSGDLVNTLIEQTPRRDSLYARIKIIHEIAIDPKHPDDADVFALALTDAELPWFQARLRNAFPGGFEESDADPDVVTQLADIGQVAVYPGRGQAASEVVIPEVSSRIARKDNPVPAAKDPIFLVDPTMLNPNDPFDRAKYEAMLKPAPVVRDHPTPEQERSGPHPSIFRKNESPEATPTERNVAAAPPVGDPRAGDRDSRRGSKVVLVWVARREGRKP